MKKANLPYPIVCASLLALLVALLARPVVAASPDEEADPVQDASGTAVRFYAGDTPSQPGRFEGRVVCLRTDKNFVGVAASECPDQTRVLALSMNAGKIVQPVLTVNQKAHDALVENLDETVVIEGRHYSSIGMILASSVSPENDDSELY